MRFLHSQCNSALAVAVGRGRSGGEPSEQATSSRNAAAVERVRRVSMPSLLLDPGAGSATAVGLGAGRQRAAPAGRIRLPKMIASAPSRGQPERVSQVRLPCPRGESDQTCDAWSDSGNSYGCG